MGEGIYYFIYTHTTNEKMLVFKITRGFRFNYHENLYRASILVLQTSEKS